MVFESFRAPRLLDPLASPLVCREDWLPRAHRIWAAAPQPRGVTARQSRVTHGRRYIAGARGLCGACDLRFDTLRSVGRILSVLTLLSLAFADPARAAIPEGAGVVTPIPEAPVRPAHPQRRHRAAQEGRCRRRAEGRPRVRQEPAGVGGRPRGARRRRAGEPAPARGGDGLHGIATARAHAGHGDAPPRPARAEPRASRRRRKAGSARRWGSIPIWARRGVGSRFRCWRSASSRRRWRRSRRRSSAPTARTWTPSSSSPRS